MYTDKELFPDIFLPDSLINIPSKTFFNYGWLCGKQHFTDDVKIKQNKTKQNA